MGTQQNYTDCRLSQQPTVNTKLFFSIICIVDDVVHTLRLSCLFLHFYLFSKDKFNNNNTETTHALVHEHMFGIKSKMKQIPANSPFEVLTHLLIFIEDL